MLSVKFLDYVKRFWIKNFVELLKKLQNLLVIAQIYHDARSAKY